MSAFSFYTRNYVETILSLAFRVAKLIHFCYRRIYMYFSVHLSHTAKSIVFIFFSGGSPYPMLKGQEIAKKLQDGYRMPKPQHVAQRL